MRSVSRALVLLPLCGASLAGSPLRANCEIGAYLIHTVAEYEDDQEGPRWHFRYRLRDGELRFEYPGSFAPAEGERVEELFNALAFGPSGLALQFRGETCTPDEELLQNGGLSKVTTLVEHVRTARLHIASCFESDLPKAGYAVYERATRTFRFGEPLEVRPLDPAAERERLEPALRAQIARLPLVVEQGGEERPRIAPEDVEGIDFAYTAIGRGNPPFTLAVALLRLRHLDRLFGGEGEGASWWGWLRDKLADFPVLFFRPPGREPYYVGDGSWCSSYRLPERTAAKARHLGPLERFEVTAAWDLDGDGAPDLLEVNEEVVYYLAPDGALFVEVWQPGC